MDDSINELLEFSKTSNLIVLDVSLIRRVELDSRVLDQTGLLKVHVNENRDNLEYRVYLKSDGDQVFVVSDGVSNLSRDFWNWNVGFFKTN